MASGAGIQGRETLRADTPGLIVSREVCELRGTYIGNGKSLVCPVWGGKLVLPSEDLSVSPDLIAFGVHEPELTNYFLKNIKKGHTVIDVGAGIGYFTVLAGFLAGPGGRVVAYEAHPGNYGYLRDNVVINDLCSQVSTCNRAVYSSPGTVSFHMAGRFRGNSSIHRHGPEYFKHYSDSVRRIEVPAEPLDVHLGRIEHINLIKMDIEGGEYHAFLGLKGLLEKRAVDTIVFELNKMMLQKNWPLFYQLLRKIKGVYGAEFFTLSVEGLPDPISLKDLFSLDGYPFVVMRLNT